MSALNDSLVTALSSCSINSAVKKQYPLVHSPWITHWNPFGDILIPNPGPKSETFLTLTALKNTT